jgi:hypothetical protein
MILVGLTCHLILVRHHLLEFSKFIISTWQLTILTTSILITSILTTLAPGPLMQVSSFPNYVLGAGILLVQFYIPLHHECEIFQANY